MVASPVASTVSRAGAGGCAATGVTLRHEPTARLGTVHTGMGADVEIDAARPELQRKRHPLRWTEPLRAIFLLPAELVGDSGTHVIRLGRTLKAVKEGPGKGLEPT